jgi:hypothetical protein
MNLRDVLLNEWHIMKRSTLCDCPQNQLVLCFRSLGRLAPIEEEEVSSASLLPVKCTNSYFAFARQEPH